MLFNNSTLPGGSQDPDKKEVLVDLKPNGKPRPWPKHKKEGQMLAVIYEMLAEQAAPPEEATPKVLRFEDTPTYYPGTDIMDGRVLEFHPEAKPERNKAAMYLEKSQRLMGCAPFVEFQKMPDGTKHLHQSSFCRVRLCPMCQWRRSLKLGAQVRQVVEKANAEKFSRDKAMYGWLLLTVTVKNVPGDKLSAEIDHIHKALHKMTLYKRWKDSVKGWLRATEVTRNYNRGSKAFGTYHPHMHLLLCVNARYFKSKDYIKKADWLAMWQKAAGLDYEPVIDITAIRTEDGQRLSDLPKEDRVSGMGKACAEVSKYAAKPSDYILPYDLDTSAETVALLDSVLENRRMTSWGGVLKDVAKRLQLDDIETGDLVHVETESEDSAANKLAEYVTYSWSVGASNYLKIAERTGDKPEEERRKKKATKHQVAVNLRTRNGKGTLEKAKKDAERNWGRWNLSDDEIQEMKNLFGGGTDESTESLETPGQRRKTRQETALTKGLGKSSD